MFKVTVWFNGGILTHMGPCIVDNEESAGALQESLENMLHQPGYEITSELNYDGIIEAMTAG